MSLRFWLRGGVKVGVVGIISLHALRDQQPKNWGSLIITEPVAAAMAAQKKAREAGADLVVCLVHMGLARSKTQPKGELIEFARNVSGFAVIFGDHTGVQWSDVNVGGQIVLETKNNGASYARTRITWDTATKTIVEKQVQFVIPNISGVVPDAKMALMLDGFRAKLGPIYSRVLAYSPIFLTRDKNCNPGAMCESIQGNLITDALLHAYPTAQFAFINTGGIRSGFACNEPGGAGFCPANQTANPPFAITVGTCRNVLPFANTLVTVKVSGQTLRRLVERSLSDGFPQISGFCVTYTNSTVHKAVFSDKGKCTERHIDLAGTTPVYGLITIEFVAVRTGFPDLTRMPEFRTQRELRDVVVEYIGRPGFVMPVVSGRIVCIGNPYCPMPTNPTKW